MKLKGKEWKIMKVTQIFVIPMTDHSSDCGLRNMSSGNHFLRKMGHGMENVHGIVFLDDNSNYVT